MGQAELVEVPHGLDCLHSSTRLSLGSPCSTRTPVAAVCCMPRSGHFLSEGFNFPKASWRLEDFTGRRPHGTPVSATRAA